MTNIYYRHNKKENKGVQTRPHQSKFYRNLMGHAAELRRPGPFSPSCNSSTGCLVCQVTENHSQMTHILWAGIAGLKSVVCTLSLGDRCWS